MSDELIHQNLWVPRQRPSSIFLRLVEASSFEIRPSISSSLIFLSRAFTSFFTLDFTEIGLILIFFGT